MTGIPVSVAPATSEGRLFPRYRNRTGILTIDSSTSRPWPFCINIDALLILDFDQHAVLAAVELLVPMTRWKGKANLSRPSGSPGNILLREPCAALSEREWAVLVSKDVQTDTARIDFGSGDYDRPVQLSVHCFALLLDNELTGFWFALRR